MRAAAAIAVLFVLAAAGTARAASLQQVGVFDRPIYVTSDPTDPNRLFVVERDGRIVEVRNGASSTFADLSSVVSTDGEQGLLSLALSPDFPASGRFYVDYTDLEGKIHVAEMRAAGSFAPLASRRDLLVIDHPEKQNHYGGQLQFGPEGLLYVSTGDGGGSNDQLHNAQSLASLLGKLLRIDPNPSGVLPYTVPPGNPFAGSLEPPFDTIWSLGLRNPYRFSFDRLTGATLIGEVGEGAREEVDYAPPGGGAGANYGWSCREGKLPGPNAAEPECATPPPGGYAEPIFDYLHAGAAPGAASGCAIVGGYVVRDEALGVLSGRYLYGDYCSGQLRSFDLAAPLATDRSEGLEVERLTSFGEDSCKRLYAASENGRVWLLVGNGSGAGACAGAQPRAASWIRIKAQGRRVRKGKRAQITAWVSPCAGRRGEAVKLLRGRRPLGTRRLDRACSVRFRPKISRAANFRVVIAEDANYVAATSRRLRVKILHKKKHRRHHKARHRARR